MRGKELKVQQQQGRELQQEVQLRGKELKVQQQQGISNNKAGSKFKYSSKELSRISGGSGRKFTA